MELSKVSLTGVCDQLLEQSMALEYEMSFRLCRWEK